MKKLAMTTNPVTPKVKDGSADQFNHTIERESLSPLQDQKGYPAKTATTPMPAPISRNSKLVGFERGRRRLQPFVGPKEF